MQLRRVPDHLQLRLGRLRVGARHGTHDQTRHAFVDPDRGRPAVGDPPPAGHRPAFRGPRCAADGHPGLGANALVALQRVSPVLAGSVAGALLNDDSAVVRQAAGSVLRSRRTDIPAPSTTGGPPRDGWRSGHPAATNPDPWLRSTAPHRDSARPRDLCERLSACLEGLSRPTVRASGWSAAVPLAPRDDQR